MRRLAPAIVFFAAACAPRPQVAPTPQPTVAAPVPQSIGSLVGETAGGLVQRFGNPALQVREGASLKLQFRRRGCVLDAYLYAPPSGGVQRVTHIDTRYASGIDANEQTCVRLLQAP